MERIQRWWVTGEWYTVAMNVWEWKWSMTSDYPQSTHSACPCPALWVLNIFFYILSRLIFFNYMGSGQRAVISFRKPRPSSPQLSPPAMSKNTQTLQNCMGKSVQWVHNKSCPDQMPPTSAGPWRGTTLLLTLALKLCHLPSQGKLSVPPVFLANRTIKYVTS